MEIFVQFILGPLLILVVGWLLDRRAKHRTTRVEYELKNRHEVNIRDDLDSKFKLVFAKIGHVTALQKKQGRVLIAMRKDISDLFENDAEQLADVQALREEIAKPPPS